MILGRVGETSTERFSVVDDSHNLVSGIDSSSFIIHLFDPSGNLDSTSIITITEMGNGHYQCNFIPSTIGLWYMVVYHPTYFPSGKSGDVQVFANDFDSITTLVTRILGLTQENFYIDNSSYDGNGNLTVSRIRIYSNPSSVGTSNDVIATYNMTASYNANSEMQDYKVVKQ